MTLAQLRGKVVLVDFWTYSCINCQRTLPHLESWYRTYKDAGLQIIGVHTPELAFEHNPGNVSQHAQALGVRYPIALDNDYATWNSYQNLYWPAEYLIDANGTVRHTKFGEGDYDITESLIRQLLTENNPGLTLPPATDVPDVTPTVRTTGETYLRQRYAPLHASGQQPQSPAPTQYMFPARIEPNTFALAGTWSAAAQSLAAGPGAELRLNCRAKKVHLVAGGHGTITVSVNGQPGSAVTVNGPPTLYTLAEQPQVQQMTVSLSAEPGVDAYSFTFD